MRTVTLAVFLEEGMYVASGHEDFEGVRYSFAAEGKDWEALKAELQELVNALYHDTSKPDRIKLHLVHDDELMVA